MTTETGAPASTRQAQVLLAAAAEYQAGQEAERRKMIAAVMAVWAVLDMKQVWPSWTIGGLGSRIYLLLSALMELVAADANGYVRKTLADQGLLYLGPDINPLNFAGVASDGRDLETLLRGAIIKVREAQRKGMSDEAARERGRQFLELVLKTQIADAARAAESVSITVADPETPAGKKVMVGFVRMLTPPSCGRCAVLAGKFYRWNSGFLRHPQCFPAGTVVSGPKIEAATRRWFEGELVTIHTASGQEFSVTGNHPILTDGGWVPARLLVEGGNVVRSLGVRSAFGHVPDDHQVPARVEDVFRALNVTSSVSRMPVAAEDFHGDGFGSEVDVVSADGLLGDGSQPPLLKTIEEPSFPLGAEGSNSFTIERGAEKRLIAVGGSASSVMSGSGLGQSLVSSHFGSAHEASIRVAADLHTVLQEARAQGATADLVLAAECILTLASRILRRDLSDRKFDGARPGSHFSTSRWDAPAGAFTMESANGYAESGRDLFHRLTGQVAFDRIVVKRSRDWSGHVYNLTSSEGWFTAESIIVSNCDCHHVPVTLAGSNEILTNPDVYFQSLTEQEQNDLFGKAQAQAIRDGGDISQVVNSARTAGSMFTADNGKRYTNEGTTKRGFARGVAGRVLRPTVWQIYKDADGDKEAAIEALRKFGFIMPDTR